MAVWATDDGVREVHGVAKNDGDTLITVKESGKLVKIEICSSWATMSAPAARHFARQINRLARRIEAREPPSA